MSWPPDCAAWFDYRIHATPAWRHGLSVDLALLACDDGGCLVCRQAECCMRALLAARRRWLERGNALRRRGPGHGETPWDPEGRWDP